MGVLHPAAMSELQGLNMVHNDGIVALQAWDKILLIAHHRAILLSSCLGHG